MVQPKGDPPPMPLSERERKAYIDGYKEGTAMLLQALFPERKPELWIDLAKRLVDND